MTPRSLIHSKVVLVSEIAHGCVRARIDNPPFNLLDPVVFAGLEELRAHVEDPRNGVKVVVLESANPDYFVAHLDMRAMAVDPEGARRLVDGWPGFSTWLHRSPAVTLAKVRGRARGIGNELALACDMRFAALETTRLAQIELGFGMVPGGGALEWLPRLVGRARALEIILGADDCDAERAEQLGWINRAVPDAELDAYVDRFARQIAGFDATALATAKASVDRRMPPPTGEELRESFETILRLAASEASRKIAAELVGKAGGTLAAAERDLPALYGARARL
jgi:enoyl-CoA hydratase/carnithine racemase